MNELNGKVAIVTGSSKGIGRAIASTYAVEGAAVVVTGRSNDAGSGTHRRTVEEIVSQGGRAIGVTCDVRNEQDIKRLVATTLDHFDRIDILVNNAGVYGPAIPSWQLPASWWKEVVDTNLGGTFLCCREVIPHMLQDGGSIINVTSMAAEYDFPVGVIDLAYSTSKQGVNRLTCFLAEELRPHNIAVNGLSPVRIKTEGVITRWGEDFDFTGYSEPEAIGPVVTFLARSRAEYTGHIVRRDQFRDDDPLVGPPNSNAAAGAPFWPPPNH